MRSYDPHIESVWERLLAVLVRMAEEVSEFNNALYWSNGCSGNATFPFRGFVSFSRSGDPSDEDLVFSLDCKTVGEMVVCNTDLSAGDGVVVADGPSLEIEDFSQKQEMESYEMAILEFLEESKQDFENRLR